MRGLMVGGGALAFLGIAQLASTDLAAFLPSSTGTSLSGSVDPVAAGGLPVPVSLAVIVIGLAMVLLGLQKRR